MKNVTNTIIFLILIFASISCDFDDDITIIDGKAYVSSPNFTVNNEYTVFASTNPTVKTYKFRHVYLKNVLIGDVLEGYKISHSVFIDDGVFNITRRSFLNGDWTPSITTAYPNTYSDVCPVIDRVLYSPVYNSLNFDVSVVPEMYGDTVYSQFRFRTHDEVVKIIIQ